MRTNLILGPPGTGKTTRLLEIMEQEMEDGMASDKIAFVAFTKKAAQEARTRAKKKFNLSTSDLVYFRTLHSLCYRELGITRGETMGAKDYHNIGEILGLRFSGYINPEGFDNNFPSGDEQNTIYQLSRLKKLPIRQVWESGDYFTSWHDLNYFAEVYTDYKKEKHLIDFTDMLELFTTECDVVDVRVAIIDEAQDLSVLQWEVVKAAFASADRIYIAGDDDQAIFQWAGADIKHFLALEGGKEILTYSYRLSPPVYKLSQQVVGRIKNRYNKPFTPKDSVEGGVHYLSSLRTFAIEHMEESWMCLARNYYMLKEYKEWLQEQGLLYDSREGKSVKSQYARAVYAWEDMRKGKTISAAQAAVVEEHISDVFDIVVEHKEQYSLKDFNIKPLPWHQVLNLIPYNERQYYRAILRNGGNLRAASNIHVDTIHGVKGGEADNIILMSDMAARSFRSYDEGEDAEHRVFYVGITRTRQHLYIVQAQSQFSYDM